MRDGEQFDRLHHDQANIQHAGTVLLNFSRTVCSIHAFTRKTNHRFGSAICTSPNIAKDAVTPP